MYLSKYTCTFYLYLQNLKTISCAYILQKLCISQTLRFMKKARNLCVVNTLILCPSVLPVIHNLDEHCADVINYFTLLLFIRKTIPLGILLWRSNFFPQKGSKRFSGNVHVIIVCVYHRSRLNFHII